MKKELFFLVFILCITRNFSFSQNDPTWDDTKSRAWPAECRKVEIISTLDKKVQPAYFFTSKNESRPLIVSLHTWSGGYEQKDTLSWRCIEMDYNYIHPHFRGPNWTPQACGSKFAIQDIEDAIGYAIEHGNIDTREIHVIGVSGGGYATFLTYMNTEYPVKTYSAWVGISDLVKWYYESEGRGTKYSFEIARSTVNWMELSKESYFLGKEEAIARSPMYMKTPADERRDSKLYIYAGIHDGYSGSVPITQSLLFYNKLVKDFDVTESEALVPDDDIIELIASRSYVTKHKDSIGDRVVHYDRNYKDLLKITIFDGGHEMLSNIALDHVEAKKILVIGDSNGASEEGWANQLKQIRFNDHFYNVSVSGNTIGFYNFNNPDLNTLVNIDRYMDEGNENLNGLDDIIIMLGTNDCKAIFYDSLKQVPRNLTILIKKIKSHPAFKANTPKIHIVSPPPIGKDEVMLKKYHGGAERIAWLYPRFRKVAKKNECAFIDIYSSLLPNWDYYAQEGIHPGPEGQRIIAVRIGDSLE